MWTLEGGPDATPTVLATSLHTCDVQGNPIGSCANLSFNWSDEKTRTADAMADQFFTGNPTEQEAQQLCRPIGTPDLLIIANIWNEEYFCSADGENAGVLGEDAI